MATPGSIPPQQSQQPQIPYGLQSQSSAPAGFPMMQQSPVPSNPMMQQSPAPAASQLTKDMNPVNMCSIGQEIVHEIVAKAQEVLSFLGPNYMKLPNNYTFTGQAYAMWKARVDEQLRLISMNFRKLRMFYSKINEACEQTEMPSEQELIPMVGQNTDSGRVQSDMYHYTLDQHTELVEQVRQKNMELKEVIDSIRSIIWEINTMITMRKT